MSLHDDRHLHAGPLKFFITFIKVFKFAAVLISSGRLFYNFTIARTLQQHNFLLESLQFLYQENDQC